MDGAQFEDDRRRIVVGQEVSADTMSALALALDDLERIDGMRRWVTDLLKPESAERESAT